jgi:hypothetical protein
MKNQVSSPTAAGKLTNRRSPRPLLRSLTLTPLLVLVALAVSAAPALAAAPEAPVTEAVSVFTGTTATLKGRLNQISTANVRYHFAYSPGPACTESGLTAPVESPLPEAGGHDAVSVPVTGFAGSAEYTVCLIAVNLEETESTEGSSVTFTTHAAPPEIPSESSSAVNSTEATLEAQVNPNNQKVNEKTTGFLRYSTTATVNGSGSLTGATKTASSEVGESYGDQPLTAPALTGLTPGTIYYYQAVATNATGTTYGAVQSFTTVPTPFTDAPKYKSITGTGAVLRGHFTLDPVPTKWSFDYNLADTTECTGENSTPTFEAGSGTASVTEEWTVPSPESEPPGSYAATPPLRPNSEYTVCLVTSNAYGSQMGAPGHFTTPPEPPVIDSESASSFNASDITLKAKINPNNQETTYSFEYATSKAALEHGGGTMVAGGSLPAELKELPVSVTVGAPQPETTYYYRVIAESTLEPGKPVVGEIKSYALPVLTTGEAQSITRTTAILTGTVNPGGAATSYHFAYIDQAGYEQYLAGDAEEKARAGGNPYSNGAGTTPKQACTEAELIANPATCDEGTTPVEIEELVKGLLPDTTYDYALVANNGGATVTGQNGTFTTAAATPPSVTTGAASAVTFSTATIAGAVNTQGLDVNYAFEVSTEAGNLGQPAGSGTIGAGTSEAGVSLALQGLKPGTTYYYRLLATSTDGTSEGAVLSFTTPGFASPLAQPATPLQVGTPNIGFPTASQANTQSPSIEVVSHRVKGKTATLVVSVPSAGKLVASGRGLSKATKTSKGATTLTVKLTLNKTEVAFLKRHHANRLKATIHLTFTTKSATELTTSTTVYIG